MSHLSSAITSLALLLFAHPLVADVIPRADVERQLYGIRGSSFGATAKEGNGLWAWDPDSGSWRRHHPLTYGYRGTGDGAAVTGTADTVVVQGTTFLEFDPVSQRLLRRYPALPPAQQPWWAFKGEYVGAERAAQLSIPTGFYGFAYCADNHVQSGPPCQPTAFPGNVTLSIENAGAHLYHRSEDGRMTLLKVLPEGNRSLALDEKRRRFWFVQRPVWNQFELGYLPLIGSTIGDPITADVQELLYSYHGPVGELLYDSKDDTLLALNWLFETPLVSRPADLSRPFQPVDLRDGGRSPMALTKLEAPLPSTYTQVIPAIGNGPGAHGTYWRSDLWLFNPSDAPTEVVLRRVANPAATRAITLAARASVELRDVLATLGGGPGEIGGDGTVTDALVVSSPYRWGAQLVAFSRNYTPAADGRGTYGQAIPAVPTRRGYSTHLYHDTQAIDVYGEAPEFFLDLRVPGQFRHNLGVVNDDPSRSCSTCTTATRSASAPNRRIAYPSHHIPLRTSASKRSSVQRCAQSDHRW